MKLTKAQRHKIYKAAKKIHLNSNGAWPYFYLCAAMSKASGIHVDIVANYFPEFAAKKPSTLNTSTTAWWPYFDSDSRLKAINECIRETAPKKKKNS